MSDWEELRCEKEWPTPNHMRHAAEAMDGLSPARYGDILRFVADLCDEPVPFNYDLAQEVSRLRECRDTWKEQAESLAERLQGRARADVMSHVFFAEKQGWIECAMCVLYPAMHHELAHPEHEVSVAR